MTVHKLTAGSGYTYLTRQVAAHDATDQPAGGLGAYYSEKGEAPGRWMGRGLAGRSDFPVGDTVTEAHMVALFGHGRHPNAAQIEQTARADGRDAQEIDRASRLGRPFGVFEASNDFRQRCAVEFRELNQALGLPAASPVSDDERARIHTEVAGAMFEERFGRPALDARELSGHLARISRQPTTAVAGYDLTFSPVKSVSTLWAIAPRDVAAVIERAHQDAVDTVYGEPFSSSPAGYIPVVGMGMVSACNACAANTAGSTAGGPAGGSADQNENPLVPGNAPPPV
ncbi:relaxase domain-containing protein [Geodermatophilaceae bacterium NBWT11]|nr:relaxase domain-containing protein [Geodermatophilaceae bacterium NBWT11]